MDLKSWNVLDRWFFLNISFLAPLSNLKDVSYNTDASKSSPFPLQGKELNAILRESDKLTEEVNSQAVKVKWAQNKLKTELETHKVNKSVLFLFIVHGC